MSSHKEQKRNTIPEIMAKKGASKLVCLTAYTAPMARILDAHVDLLLVGDSLGMVLYGHPSTLKVSVPMMAQHGAAVVQGSQKALVVIDMPFGSYQQSPPQAFANAASLLAETGAQAVKLEGGAVMADTVAYLVARGVPVMGHIGLTPQSVNVLGGYRVQGRSQKAQALLLKDAKALEQAGAFSVVLEAVPAELATRITASLAIPTIGIGAGAGCDGQILVSEDMLGLTLPPQRGTGQGDTRATALPRFVKLYADLASQIDRAASAYKNDVIAKHFPEKQHGYDIKISTKQDSVAKPVGKRKK